MCRRTKMANHLFEPLVLITSHLERENVCPRCNLPFMYGKGKVQKNFSSGLFLGSSGASTSYIFASSHLA